jgi:CheY-like chemotaxis protein
VEDDALIILVAQDALEAGGYTVIPASTGPEAMRALEERRAEFAGLVTDIQLGSGPNGWEVARHARGLQADLPIVYTTGDSGAQWPIQGVPNGVLVQKPYAPAQLLTAISTLMTTADTNRTS